VRVQVHCDLGANGPDAQAADARIYRGLRLRLGGTAGVFRGSLYCNDFGAITSVSEYTYVVCTQSLYPAKLATVSNQVSRVSVLV